MIMLVRGGVPVGEALQASLSEKALDWKSGFLASRSDERHHVAAMGYQAVRRAASGADSSGGGGGGSTRDSSRTPARQSRTSWKGGEIVSMAPGGRMLCPGFNKGTCRDPCPKKALHECRLKLRSGAHCGKSGNKHPACKCTNPNTIVGR